MEARKLFYKGVLRPVEPVSLPEGARVEGLILTPTPVTNGEDSIDVLDRIAALPLEGDPGPLTSQDYESILYPKDGERP